MSVYLTIPSARPIDEVAPVFDRWRSMGYKIAIWRDDMAFPCGIVDYIRSGDGAPYPGYAAAVNALIADVLKSDSSADWFIAAGDDTFPDPLHPAEEIAAQCREYYGDRYQLECDGGNNLYRLMTEEQAETYGVMQPTGDRFAGGSIDRIAGSAWIGREFARRVYGGNGPLWLEFTHMFVDEHLKAVAEKLGVYSMRPDLIHLHRHYQRESDAICSNAVPRPWPAHMQAAKNDGYTQEHWDRSKEVFDRLKAGGFAEVNDLLA